MTHVQAPVPDAHLTPAQRKAAQQAANIAARDAKRKQRQDEREAQAAKEKAERQEARDKKRAAKQADRDAAEKKAAEQREADRHAQRLKRQQQRDAEKAAKIQAKADKKAKKLKEEENAKAERKNTRANNVVKRRALFESRHAQTKTAGIRRPKASFIIYTAKGFSNPQSVSIRGRILKWIKENVPEGGAIPIADVAKACKPFLYGASVRGFLSKLEETGHIDFWYGDAGEEVLDEEGEAAEQ